MLQWEEKLAEVIQFIEKDLLLLGVIAVEDKLQDKVKESIESLKWMISKNGYLVEINTKLLLV